MQRQPRRMEEQKEQAINGHRAEIVSRIRTCLPSTVSFFLEENILTRSDQDSIHIEKTPYDKASKLIDILVTRDNRAYYKFLEALKTPEVTGMPDLATKVEKTYQAIKNDTVQLLDTEAVNMDELAAKFQAETNLRESAKPTNDSAGSILERGRVPVPPAVLSSPPPEVQALLLKIVASIHNLRNRKTPGFLLIYGDSDTTSESELLAAALRVQNFWHGAQQFPTDIIWQKMEKAADEGELYLKLKSLLTRMDERYQFHHKQPETLEEGRKFLRNVFLNNADCLLVLEDVRTFDVIEQFIVHPKTVVTTHVKELVNAIHSEALGSLVEVIYVGRTAGGVPQVAPYNRTPVKVPHYSTVFQGSGEQPGVKSAEGLSSSFIIQPIETDGLKTTPNIQPGKEYMFHIGHQEVLLTPTDDSSHVLNRWRYENIREFGSRPVMFSFKAVHGRDDVQFRFRTQPGMGKEIHEKMRAATRRRMGELSS